MEEPNTQNDEVMEDGAPVDAPQHAPDRETPEVHPAQEQLDLDTEVVEQPAEDGSPESQLQTEQPDQPVPAEPAPVESAPAEPAPSAEQ